MGKRLGAVALTFAIMLLATACSDGDEGSAPPDPPSRSLACEWPMFGRDTSRTFAYPARCETALAPDTVPRLRQKWFLATTDVVTATPAVADDTAFVGDWSGRFYAISLETGKTMWTYAAPPQKNVYSGQIVAGAAIADVDGERRVFFASGKTLYAVTASDGTLRWKHTLNPSGGADDVTEIQSSPVVVDGMVIFGYDGHDSVGTRAGMVALEANDGSVRWNFDPDGGRPPTGCGGVWSSPAVDTTLGLVFAGTANCPSSPTGWTKFSEAIFAVDLETGEPKWSYQPARAEQLRLRLRGRAQPVRRRRPRGRRAGRQGRRVLRGRPLDREARVETTVAGAARPVEELLHGRVHRHDRGRRRRDRRRDHDRRPVPVPARHHHGDRHDGVATERARADVRAERDRQRRHVHGSTTDFTLRAVDLHSGKVLWSQQLAGGVAGGVAISGDTVVAVAGIREPGVAAAGKDFGVYTFELGPEGTTATTAAPKGTLPPTPDAPAPTAPDPNAPPGPKCVGQPCELDFTLKAPPPGTNPTMTVHLRPQPFRIEVRADDLGDPTAWIRPDSPTAKVGAVAYGVFVSDDALKGSLLCVLDKNFDCVNEVAPENPRPSYNRISILAIENTPELPSASAGFDRLVTTESLQDPVSFK